MLNRKIIYSTVLICSLIIAAISVFAQSEKSFNVTGGGTCDISLNKGSVEIGTWNKDQVYVKALNVDKADLQNLSITQEQNTIVVKFQGDNSNRFKLEVSVPENFNLDVSTAGGNIELNGNLKGNIDFSTGGGNIITGNVTGMVDVSTAGGNITTGDITGKADLSTSGGEIKTGKISGSVDVSTFGGSISIKEVTEKADISTMGGNISVGKVGSNADISTMGGNISVGNVNGSADISTAGGNISLGGALNSVNVSTGGGNISLKNIKGKVDVSTGAGEIYIELFPTGSELSSISTGVGNVKLMIPSDSKATVTANVGYSGLWNDQNTSDYIKSDFPEATENVHSDKKGDSLTKVFIINGGGTTVEVSTGMGKIEIRKMK
ncbi:MAG: hypothetical protein Kow0098_01760 [Ignavibacteriaceae bacterium]